MIAVISDIHGNEQALRAVLAEIGEVEAIFCDNATQVFGRS